MKEPEQDSAAAPAEGEDAAKTVKKDPWSQKAEVLGTVIEKVESIKAYRQRQFDLKREKVAKQVEERERKEQEAK